MHALVRHPGGGRKKLTVQDPQIKEAIEPDSRGDPESALCWMCKSVRILADGLTAQQHPFGRTRVAELLHELGYSLQSNRKPLEGSTHPDRDEQFRHINASACTAMDAGEPLIPVDAKKRSWLNASRMPARVGAPRTSPKRWPGMTSSPSEVVPTLMASMIFRPTPAGSMPPPITTRRALRSSASGDGGNSSTRWPTRLGSQRLSYRN